MGSDIVGREPELEAIGASLDDVQSGPRAILITGRPGIGKTTVWQGALPLAAERGYRVLSSRSAEPEAKLSHAGLGDLLGDAVDDVKDALPAPQRRALDVALLRTEKAGRGADRRAVAVATLGAVKALAAHGPILVAIDDVQWIDEPSAYTLSFALRRLTDEPVAVAVTLRESQGYADPLDLEHVFGPAATRLVLGPITVDSLARIVRLRFGEGLPRPALVRVHETSRGNPLLALEIVRALHRDGSDPEPGEPLPVPDDLGSLLRARIEALPARTRQALLLASAATRPTLSLLRSALGRLAEGALGKAEDAGVVHVRRDEISFTHPLLASAVYRSASSERRRIAHRRLSAAVVDPEEQARHLALATPEPDPDVARALEDAARHAYRRGAPGAAAELVELARRATPSAELDDARRRGLKSAEYRFVAGDGGAAHQIANEVLHAAPAGLPRAEALYLLSVFSWTDVTRLRPLLEAAEAEAPEGSAVFVSALADHGWMEIQGGDLRLASRRARRAIELAERLADPEPLSLALVTAAYAEYMLGQDVTELLTRALALESRFDEPPGVSYALSSARNTLGAQLMWSGDLRAARRELERHLRDLIEQGQYMMLWEGLIYLSELESRAGDYHRALAHAEELLETMVEAGYEQARETGLWVRSLAEAHLGLVDRARNDATEGLALAEQHEDLFHTITNRSVLGFIELSLGDHEATHRYLDPLPELLESRGIVEPGIYPFVPDAVEALTALGHLDRAEEVLAPYDRHGRELERPLVRATSARSRGLLAAARGDREEALEWLGSAVDLHGRLAQPFELARTRLVQGDVLRRMKRKREARAALEAAAEGFERLGAPLWAAKARGSLARISGRAATRGLTETQRQVARLVAEGKTNREVAQALFVSVKTVEANLSRIYAKLGITSRRELSSGLLDRAESG